MEKTCPQCKTVFVDKKHPDKIYCSTKCVGIKSRKRFFIPCKSCGIMVSRAKSTINNNIFCSNKCYGIFKIGKPSWNKGKHIINGGTFKKREEHPNWKGGNVKRPCGKGYYIHNLSHNHPNCDSRGYVFQHRLVMEKHVGRYLRPEEVVHHINEIKSDNRIENLLLLPNAGAHTSLHNKLRNLSLNK